VGARQICRHIEILSVPRFRGADSRWRSLQGGFLIAVLLLAMGCDSGRLHDIILVSVDTLRADHLGCYGYPRPTSPHIDAFAAEALLFENAISHGSSTIPTVVSIMTGFLPHETKAIEAAGLPLALETLPEMLQDRGYTTIAVVSNFILRGKGGFSKGFSLYDEEMVDREQVLPQPERIAEHTTDRAIQLLERHAGNRLFIWIHYQDPHVTYTPPPRFAEPFIDAERAPRLLRANETMSGLGGIPSHGLLGSHRDYHYYVSQYDGEIRYLDEHLGRLFEALKRQGRYEKALIIFTADHGENMGEHGYFFSHGENLLHGVTHVPLIVKRGSELRGRRTDFVQHVDIVPTVLHSIGASARFALRGHDLLEHPSPGREIFAESAVWWSNERRVYFVLRDGIKLIYRPSVNRYHLFDINADPEEEADLVGEARYRQQVAELRRAMIRIRSEDRIQLGHIQEPAKLTEEERQKLKSLGYLR
jgi:arylsulfatase